MTGWEKVAALTALYVVGAVWANIAMLRRVKGAVAARRAWTAADFDAAFAPAVADADADVDPDPATDPATDPRVAPAVRAVLARWYGEGVVPQPEDRLRRFLKMDRGDVDDVVAQARARLSLPASAPFAGPAPDLPDVAALVRHLDGEVRARARR